MFRDLIAVWRKDMAIELKTRVAVWQVLPFSVLVVVMFAFALGPNPASLRHAAPGLFWLGVLFSMVLLVGRSVSIESGDGVADATRLYGVDPAGQFLGKAAAVGTQLLVVEIVLVICMVAAFHLAFHAAWIAILAAALGTAGLSATGTIYGALAAGARAHETLLPMLVLPVVAPVLIAGVRAWQDAAQTGASAAPWLNLLAVFAVVYLLLGSILYGPLQETT